MKLNLTEKKEFFLVHFKKRLLNDFNYFQGNKLSHLEHHCNRKLIIFVILK